MTRTGHPPLAADATLRLYDAHRPSLVDGDYRVTITQKLVATGVSWSAAPAAPTEFSVAGPRCALPPAAVASVFPPDAARGVFTHVLPHVVLDRATLPWERSADRDPGTDAVGWLAVLVLSEAEARRVTLTHTTAAEALRRTGLKADASDDPAETAALLTLPADLVDAVLPDRDTLRLLTHVRTADDHESAVVVAHRFPAAGGRGAVHLVSLEGRFAPGATRVATGGKPVEVVSLATWDVFCLQDPEIDFATLAGRLAPKASTPLLRLPPDGIADADARSYAAAGFVPVTHRLRTGRDTVSWYHGPLLPGRAPLAATPLPVRAGDELLVRDAGLGILDCSYAAAWELGRLIVLARPRTATALLRWKQAHARHELAVAAHAEHADLPLGTTPPVAPDFGGLTAFFTDDLAHLAAVPFDYLVADPAMLPPGSLRFFTVDRAWVECLMDGAFSMGRTTGDAHEADTARRDRLPAVPEMSGVLIRSPLVSGFPGLLVDGYAAAPPSGARDQAHLAQTSLKVLRDARLGPDVALVLFEGHARTVDLHLHPGTMHFGFPDTLPVPAGADRVLRWSDLRARGVPTGSPAALARGLITGVPLVRFVREEAP